MGRCRAELRRQGWRCRLPPPAPIWPGAASPFAPAQLPEASPFAAKSLAVSPSDNGARGNRGAQSPGERRPATPKCVIVRVAEGITKLTTEHANSMHSHLSIPSAGFRSCAYTSASGDDVRSHRSSITMAERFGPLPPDVVHVCAAEPLEAHHGSRDFKRQARA